MKVGIARRRARGPGPTRGGGRRRVARGHATVLLACLALSGSAQPARAADVPTFDEVRAAHRPSDIPLLDRHGAVLQLVRQDPRVRRGPWLALADVSPALRTAIVLGEDRRFWDHGGVDWHALAASAWAQAFDQRTRGASTLTMQLAALSDEQLARPRGGRSVAAKWTQIQRARAFEARWRKAQILEAYLNRVPLRGELVGVAAASQQLFGKHASGLDAVESALLAALVRAPNAAPALVQRRACALLQLQALGCEPLAATWAAALARRPGPALAAEALAPHLAQAALRGAPPGATSLPTTLDARIQRLALGALSQQLAELRGRSADDGAVVVLDNGSGEVLAWVGSAGPGSGAAEVDAVLARRQPGSAVKPFVYALALQQRLITAASRLDDAPLALDAGGALYQPQNYDGGYKGLVSARQALAGSLNVPAVRVAAMLGPDALFETMQHAGLDLARSAGHHGHALALGSAEVSLLGLTNAYRVLANGGRHTPARWQRGGTAAAPRRVFEPGVAWLVADILADPAARAASFGFDSPLLTRGWAAVKTGTSKDMRDNWCVGFSRRYTVGVWVGNASGEPMHDVSGTSGAAPAWRALMLALHDGEPSQAPAPPAGLMAQGGEWFLAGTGPAPGAQRVPTSAVWAAGSGDPVEAPVAAGFGITSPRAGSIVVLDPDIPPAAQRLVIAGAPGVWLLDGREIGRGMRLTWLPRPGRHVLERRPLAPAVGEAPERIAFEVRAAPPPARAAAVSSGRR